jgi:hypothetical protein
VFARAVIEAVNGVSVAEGKADLDLADRVEAVKKKGLEPARLPSCAIMSLRRAA